MRVLILTVVYLFAVEITDVLTYPCLIQSLPVKETPGALLLAWFNFNSGMDK